MCLQETKKEYFDSQFLKNIFPSSFGAFEFLPSNGASGGILVTWKSFLFSANKIFSNDYSLSMEFISAHNDAYWVLTCEGKTLFLNWLKEVKMPDNIDWLILGDFNLIRKQEDRNKPRGSIAEMLMFNETINLLGLNEIVLQGRKFTWSNMQPSPLLEKLDWVFTSNSWTLSYPNTSAKALDMTPSDHTPCVISISTAIPRSKVFRFENFWLLNEQFAEIVTESWATPNHHNDKVKSLTAKFKLLREKLKEWQAAKTGLKALITNTRVILQFLEVLGEYKDLSIEEWNFREFLKNHLLELLEQQRIYWKQRGTIKWVKLGDAGTSFFHAVTTIRHRGNLISELLSSDGSIASEHSEKEQILWEGFKIRRGTSEFNGFVVDPG